MTNEFIKGQVWRDPDGTVRVITDAEYHIAVYSEGISSRDWLKNEIIPKYKSVKIANPIKIKPIEPTKFGTMVRVAGVEYVRVKEPDDYPWVSNKVVDGSRIQSWSEIIERGEVEYL